MEEQDNVEIVAQTINTKADFLKIGDVKFWHPNMVHESCLRFVAKEINRGRLILGNHVDEETGEDYFAPIRQYLTASINRVEVIDEKGRSYVNWDDANEVTIDVQDSGRTLKIFIKKTTK